MTLRCTALTEPHQLEVGSAVARWASASALGLTLLLSTGHLLAQTSPSNSGSPSSAMPDASLYDPDPSLDPDPRLRDLNRPAQTRSDLRQQDRTSANRDPQTGRARDSYDRTQDQYDRTRDPSDRTREEIEQTPDRPTQFQQLVRTTTGQLLPIFGTSLFRNVPSTFAPVDNAPVGADYILGPGDEVRIQIFGAVNDQQSFTIDRAGSVQIPNLGPIHLAGLRFDAASRVLKAHYSKLYRNFDLSVDLGRLRTIQVFVVGQARRPGSYTVSSLSTLLNALFASGGVLPQGSLRAIQLLRNGQAVVTFDLYDLLLHGDKSKDVRLEPGDVIFVPVAGAQVAVTGSVVNPAIYEAAPGTTVRQLLALGGGGTSVATLNKLRIDRVFEHTMRSAIDVDLTKDQNPAVVDGDIITVAAITDRFNDAVTLRGNVANPGRYVWHPGMRITDLIPNKDALITRDYFRKRNQLGQFVAEFGDRPQTPATGTLQTRDTTTDPTTQRDLTTRTLTGRPDNAQNNQGNGGTNSTSGSGGTSISSALTASDNNFGPKTDVVLSAPDINWSYAVIERQNPVDLTSTLVPFSLGRIVLQGDQSANLEIFPNDIVTIFSIADMRVPTAQQTRFVRLEGEFFASGIYSVLPGETLHQLLRRAGGFTPDAYLFGSSFTRQSTQRVEKQRLNEYADSLEAQIAAYTSTSSARALSVADAAATAAGTADAQRVVARLRRLTPEGRIVLPVLPDSRTIDSLPDLALEDGDRFVVPRVPSVVNVEGQVYSANAFVFTRGRRTRDYIRQAGGPDRTADRGRAFVLRADGSVFSQQYGNVLKANIFPGDTIVLPPVLHQRAILRELLDISSIIGQFGIGVAAINVLK